MTESIFIALVVLGVIAVCFVISYIDNMRRIYKIKRRLEYNYGRWREVDYSDAVLSVIGEYTAAKDSMIDDITWNDLDMDALFMSIDHTWSFAGEDYLYYLLHVPKVMPEEWEEQEEMITYYQEHEKERIEMQMEFARIGKNHASSVYSYIMDCIRFNTKVPPVHYFSFVFFIFSVVITVISPSEGLGLLILAMVVNVLLYFYKRKELEGSMQALQYFKKLMEGAKSLTKKKLICNPKYHSRVEKDYRHLKKLMGASAYLGPANWDSPSIAEMFLDYIRLVTHIDCIFFYHCMSRLGRNIDIVENMFTTMGFLESMLAVGSLREALPVWCRPEFTDEKMLRIIDAYHPGLKEPVPNSVSVKDGILITGSNASGKSTFLKTIAMNVILAQSLHTCPAKAYCGKWFHVFSSMALKDSLYKGESYYIAEIRALKRVMEPVEEEAVICFVDEVLRGTNTVERIAASTQVLKEFQKKGILCFAATHDIELTYLLEEQYDNYHFQEQVADGEIIFDYLIYDGRATSRNAIQLLEILGYEPEIINGAKAMVEQFLSTGKWN